MKSLKLAVVMAFLAFTAFAQQPPEVSVNPYRLVYGLEIRGHWTDSLKWWNVVPVTSFGAIPDDNNDDFEAIQRGIDSLNSAGGGVLYFPPGMYQSSENLTVKTGVILRGQPHYTGKDAVHDASFEPTSKIWFPKYVFDTLANNGNGVDNSTAFKGIIGALECSNAGVVDLDINRAYIKFQPHWESKPGFPNRQPVQQNRNIIVMGNRNSNAVIPGPEVPNSQQKPWQRFPWRFSTNIDVNVMANGVIACNRLNYGVEKDNFLMLGYAIQQRNSNPPRMINLTESQRPMFDYDAHYGISLNRKKMYKDANGIYRIDGYVTWASPQNEPTLFCTGLEILDNWMYKNNRVGVIAAGIGLVIKRNKIRDDATKPTRTDWFGPVGTVTPQGATTFENRGYDFSGWNIVCDSNDAEVFRHRAGGYLSTDGEGVLVQECCGGTQVNDYTIRGNNMITGSYIGIYKMRDINNIKIENNDLNGGPVWVWANTNNNSYFLNSTVVRNNRALSGISMNGSLGGTVCYVEDNQGTGNINVPCHTIVQNNTGFTGITYNSGGGAPCTPSTDYPQGVFTEPAEDGSYCNGNVPLELNLVVQITESDPSTATVDIMLGNQILAAGLIPDGNGQVSYNTTLPAADGIYSFTAVIRNNGNMAFSPVRTLRRICNDPASLPAAKSELPLSLFPNPASTVLNVFVAEEGVNTMVIFNSLGQQILPAERFSERVSLVTENLPKGVYRVLVTNKAGQRKAMSFVKN